MDTWLILVAICVLLACLIATIFALVIYSGSFEGIEVKAGKPPIGKVVIAYKFARGPYTEAGPLFFEVAKIAPDHKALAIYYNDTSKVESQHQQYAVACILAEEEEEVDEELVKKFEAEGFKMATLPPVDYAVHSSFPYKSALSIFIGMKKIFPTMAEYIQEHGLQAHPFLEIYSGNTIYYMAPLDKQEKFYVPESLQKPSEDAPYESVPSTEQGGNLSEGDSHMTERDMDRPETESLLHPSQIVKAEVIGRVEEVEKTAEEETKNVAGEAESREDSPEVDSSCITEEAKKERGSDEESGSSFEELKMEGDEVCEKSQPQ